MNSLIAAQRADVYGCRHQRLWLGSQPGMKSKKIKKKREGTWGRLELWIIHSIRDTVKVDLPAVCRVTQRNNSTCAA